VKTDTGSNSIGKFVGILDSRAAYAALYAAYRTGEKGRESVKPLEEAFKKLKLDAHWTKSRESFLATWERQLRDIQTALEVPYDETTQITRLKDAIRPSEDMYTAIAKIDTMNIQFSSILQRSDSSVVAGLSAKDLTLDDYLFALESTAVHHDSLDAGRRKTSRSVQMTKLKPDGSFPDGFDPQKKFLPDEWKSF
jgi:hypothetical protein